MQCYILGILTGLIIMTQGLFGANVGLLVMATGRYIAFIDPLVRSAEEHFCRNHNVTYFVFTDGALDSSLSDFPIVTIPQNRLGWPFDTMMRFQIYANSSELLSAQDYLFACDADMLFVGKVGDEILSARVATEHPGFVGQRGSYETNPESKACIYPWEGKQYYAGGFYGGTTEEVLRLAHINAASIDDDLSRGIIAVWHDESHWNRYCVDNPPTLILNPSYCYPESWNLPYPRKLLALDKNHDEIRKAN